MKWYIRWTSGLGTQCGEQDSLGQSLIQLCPAELIVLFFCMLRSMSSVRVTGQLYSHNLSSLCVSCSFVVCS